MREFVKSILPASARQTLRSLLEQILEPLVQREVGRSSVAIRERLERIERHVFAKPYVNPEFVRAAPRPANNDRFDYFGFEQKFRGPSRVIQDQLRFYLPHFLDRELILDLGCGRGEFLDVLRERGLSGIGVEIDADQAAECRGKGHNVVQGDLNDYLTRLPDESVDAIFSAQMVEHLPFNELVTLFCLAFRKLKSNGLMIAETVNPHCTAAFKFFWLDPSHIAPLYPEVVHFLAESAGFGAVEIVYPELKADPQRLYHECGNYALVATKSVGAGMDAVGRSEDADGVREGHRCVRGRLHEHAGVREAVGSDDMADPSGTATLPIPPFEMRQLVGPTDEAAFDNASRAPIFGVAPERFDHVLDFGCGCGRLARQMLQQVPRPRRYTGFDLHTGMIRWCNANLAPLAPGFTFLHHDVANVGLNPGWRKKPFRPMPAEDGSISLLIAHSVFTHVIQAHAEYYLREATRVLRPDGEIVASFFLFEKRFFPMMHDFQNALYINTDDPTNAVVFDREWLQASLRELGLGVVRVQPPRVRGFQWALHIRRLSAGEPIVDLPEDRAPFGRVPPPIPARNPSKIGR